MTGEMSIMSHKGDVKVIWDSEKEAEVAAAKAQFEALVGKGYAAFKVKKDGSEGAQILHGERLAADKVRCRLHPDECDILRAMLPYGLPELRNIDVALKRMVAGWHQSLVSHQIQNLGTNNFNMHAG